MSFDISSAAIAVGGTGISCLSAFIATFLSRIWEPHRFFFQPHRKANDPYLVRGPHPEHPCF
jgi:hypothetical protein